jgi:signal transduction histidine kinase
MNPRPVSCRALGGVIKAVSRRKINESILIEGTGYSIEYLRNAKNRIEWDVFCQILRNTRKVWSFEDLSKINQEYVKTPFFSYLGVVSRLLFNSRDLFAWIAKQSVGGGAQLFSECVKSSFYHIGTDATVIRLEIEEPHTISEEFFWLTNGAFVSLPSLVGAGLAEVSMTSQGRVGTYHIRYKNRRSTLFSLIRLLTWPLTARTAARELLRTNEELQSRFYELEDARTKIDRQATHLRTAHMLNDLILRDLGINSLLDTVVKALVEEAGFTRAEIALVGTEKQPARVACYGAGEIEPAIRRSLESGGGQKVGELVVSVPPEENPSEREALLALITPTLGTGIQNVLYRSNLERLVEVRTTELTDARDRLAATVEQLREAQSARERFFGNISHEIRTPLTIIMLAAADIEQRAGAVLDDRSKAGLVSVTDASRKLVRLVDELLLLAAGQEGKLRTHPEPTDMVALVKLLASTWLLGAEQARLSLEARTPAALIANVDPVAIERVASNLMSNAVKYTPAGGSVEIELAEEPDGVRLSVFDTGPGIDEELARRLFGRFERSIGEDRRKTGTGLGLSLVKQLVEAHGGTIEAYRRPTGGAELRVILPPSVVLRDLPQPAEPVLQLAPETRAATENMARLAPAGAAKGSIVLAEDDTALAEMVAKLLAEEFVVFVAHDGSTALELVRAHHPQMLITDLEMPGLSGIDLARRFRELSGDRLAPIIILSAVIDLGPRITGLEAGAIDYVTKPFEPAELRARVRAQFRVRDLTLRLQRAEQFSMLGILTSGLAHELRNPANGIVNAIGPLIELLPPELTTEETAVGQLLEAIKACAEQIGFLSRQLLGFRGGDVDLDLRPAPIGEIVERSMLLARRALAGIEVRNRLPKGLKVNCAPPLMTQVLTNLIENAGHAAAPGGWVEIRANIADGRCALEVADSGSGVPRELRDRVFEPFFTTKPVGKGTGLGLSVARDIIHRHGGLLEIRDRDERAFFVIDLPHPSDIDTPTNTVS